MTDAIKPFGVPSDELEKIKEAVMEAVKKYGSDDGPTHQRILADGIWNDHIAVQAGIAVWKMMTAALAQSGRSSAEVPKLAVSDILAIHREVLAPENADRYFGAEPGAAPQGQRAVKALEWVEVAEGPRCITVCGTYAVHPSSGPYGRATLTLTGMPGDLFGKFETLEAAQDAAQADYSRRILSTLAPSAAPGEVESMAEKLAAAHSPEAVLSYRAGASTAYWDGQARVALTSPSAEAAQPVAEPVEWLWFGEAGGEQHISFGRWQNHKSQYRYKYADIQATEHDHHAQPQGELREALEAALSERDALRQNLAVTFDDQCRYLDRVTALEKGLAPFAAIGRMLEGASDGHAIRETVYTAAFDAAQCLTVGDFRDAAALSPKLGEEKR